VVGSKSREKLYKYVTLACELCKSISLFFQGLLDCVLLMNIYRQKLQKNKKDEFQFNHDDGIA